MRMKFNKAEITGILLTMLASVICVILFFLNSDSLFSGRGNSSEPLPQYVEQESKVNINAATIEEIAAIEGISRKVAEDIALYRNITPITDIEQLLDIDGIDEATLKFVEDKIKFVN